MPQCNKCGQLLDGFEKDQKIEVDKFLCIRDLLLTE